MRFFRICLLAVLVAAGSPLGATEPYDLIFKKGTLSDLSPETVLAYERTVEVPANPSMSERNTGLVKLTFEPEDMARLKFYQGKRHRNIGSFPATVGNPMILYFVETVVREMAQNTGGSSFYIRNRVKDSLISKADIRNGTVVHDGAEVSVSRITLRPFLNDKNRDRMRGYDDLALTITMSEDVPGWYFSLEAQAGGKDGSAPVYTNALKLVPEEGTR